MPKHIPLKDAKLVNKHLYILKTLSTASKHDRRKILNNAPNTLFKVLKVILKSFIPGAIPSDKLRVRLCKKLTGSTRTIKENVIQNGGALPLLLAGIIPVIGELLSKIIK